MGRLLASLSRSLSLSRSPSSISISTVQSSSPSPSPSDPFSLTLHKFEADLAERLLHLTTGSSSSPTLNWLSDAMAVLLSTQSSALSTLAPAIRSLLPLHHHDSSPAYDTYRTLIQEHLDCSVALLDVCKSLKEATCELEHHLGRLDHTLSQAASACSRSISSGGASIATAQLQAAGRRLAACLPAQDVVRRRSNSRPTVRAAGICSNATTTPISWQQRLAEAQVSLRSLKKSLKSMQPLSTTHPDPAFAAALQALNGTTLTTALLLSAVTSSLMSLSSSSGLRSSSWRNMSAASRRRRRGACILSRSVVVEHVNAGAKNPWALPLGKLQQDLEAHEVEEVGKPSGGTQLDQIYVLGHMAASLLMMQRHSKAHSGVGSTLGLMKLGVGNVVKEVREMRGSIAGLQAQSVSLSQALAAVRVALLNALL